MRLFCILILALSLPACAPTTARNDVLPPPNIGNGRRS